MTEQAKKRPEFRNINFFKDLPTYRLPPAGIVSILHRISGLLMFILLPFILWMMDMSLTSEISFDGDRKSTRLNSSHLVISYAVFCLKKKKNANLSILSSDIIQEYSELNKTNHTLTLSTHYQH